MADVLFCVFFGGGGAFLFRQLAASTKKGTSTSCIAHRVLTRFNPVSTNLLGRFILWISHDSHVLFGLHSHETQVGRVTAHGRFLQSSVFGPARARNPRAFGRSPVVRCSGRFWLQRNVHWSRYQYQTSLFFCGAVHFIRPFAGRYDPVRWTNDLPSTAWWRWVIFRCCFTDKLARDIKRLYNHDECGESSKEMCKHIMVFLERGLHLTQFTNHNPLIFSLQKCPVLIPNHYRFLGLYNNSSRAKNQTNSNSELAEKYVIQASLEKLRSLGPSGAWICPLTQSQRYGGVTTLNKGPGPVWNAAV